MAEAFLSVHDMIHAAIRGQGGTASLRQIYAASQARGRIIYKRAGGSRLITSNEHWKSQIRHALYTSGRFRRAPGSTDEWQMAEGFGAGGPSTALIEVSVGEDQRQSAESAARAAARKGGRGAAKPRADRLVATGAPKRTSRGGGKKKGGEENSASGSGSGSHDDDKGTSVRASRGAAQGGGGGGPTHARSAKGARPCKGEDAVAEVPGGSDRSNRQQASGPTAESTPPPSHRSRDTSPGAPPLAPLSERNGSAPGRRRGGKRRGAPGPAGPEGAKRAAPALNPALSDSDTGGDGRGTGPPRPPPVHLPLRLEEAAAAGPHPGGAPARAPAAAAAAAAAAWTVAALMEEEAVDVRELLKLSPVEAQAFTNMLLAYDRGLALRVQSVLQGAGSGGAPAVRVSGVAKVMVTTFLHSVACQRSLRSAAGAYLARPVPLVPGGDKGEAAGLAAAANSQLSAATTLGELSRARVGHSGPAAKPRARAA